MLSEEIGLQPQEGPPGVVDQMLVLVQLPLAIE